MREREFNAAQESMYLWKCPQNPLSRARCLSKSLFWLCFLKISKENMQQFKRNRPTVNSDKYTWQEIWFCPYITCKFRKQSFQYEMSYKVRASRLPILNFVYFTTIVDILFSFRDRKPHT